MFNSKVYLWFALLVVCISNSFAESATPPKQSEFTYDSKHRFTCGGYSLNGMVSELDGDNQIYKADTDTLVCTFGMVFQKCADDSRCKCPPAEWDENECWTTYGKLRQKYLDNLRQIKEPKKAKP